MTDAPSEPDASAPEAPGEVTQELAPVPAVLEAAPVAAAIEPTPMAAAIETAAAPTVPVVPAPAAAVTEPISHVAPRRRRRWPWVLLGVVLFALILVSGAVLWYVSGLIGAGASVARPTVAFPLTVVAADAGSVSYSGSTEGWVDQGLMGVATVEGGYAQTTRPQVTQPGSATRPAVTARAVTTQVLPPIAAVGQQATLDGWFFPRNPKVGLGLDYEDVLYDSLGGPTPAWVIPGSASTWVIFTHGRGATPLEGLRIAQTTASLGYPTMLIRYRDDARAPVEDGLGNFGATEWPDLEAAVQYALDHGASDVVLAGASMGGSITLAFLQNSALADRVTGAFLDSPLTDFGQVVELSAQDMGLPSFVTSAAMRVASWRYGFDWAATDYTAGAASFTTPMLIVQGSSDVTVPAQVAEDFAAAANPATVSVEVFEGAGHVMSWNVDRPRYQALLTSFLAKVAPTQ